MKTFLKFILKGFGNFLCEPIDIKIIKAGMVPNPKNVINNILDQIVPDTNEPVKAKYTSPQGRMPFIVPIIKGYLSAPFFRIE